METESIIIKDLSLTAEQRKAVAFIIEFTRRMVLLALTDHMTRKRVSSLSREIYRFTDELMTGSINRGTPLPCKKGCYWCCYLRVMVTPLEVMAIVDYLHSHLQPAELVELKQHVNNTDGIIRGMDSRRRMSAKKVCQLLVDGACLAYPARPIACRVYHSLNPSGCKASLEKEQSSLSIRRDIFGLSAGIFFGLTDGLRTLGLQTLLLDLKAGLRIAMSDSGPKLAKQWLSGAPAFAAAELANAKEIERIQQLLIQELGNVIEV